jgi:ABC-type branched-subunit amino acid transport system ATPase component
MTTMDDTGPILLKTERVLKRFGGLIAVNDVTFEVARGQATGLIGPNGAGKSTMFDLITGGHPRPATSTFAASASLTSPRTSEVPWAWRAPSRSCGCSKA